MVALNCFRNIWYGSPKDIAYIQGKVLTGSNNIKSYTTLSLPHYHIIALENYSDTSISQNMHAVKLDILRRISDKIAGPSGRAV